MRYLTIFMLVAIIGEMTLLLMRPAPFPTAGATITTIAGSDTLSASRSVINTNFSNLNADIATINTDLASVWTFSNGSNFGMNVISTTSPAWFKNGLMASSTSYFANASSTQFSVGTFYQTTSATSTFTGGISFTRFDLTATSTGSKGINITDGCFAKNGACIGATGSVTGSITASTTNATDAPATQGVITVPADYILVITANGNSVGTGLFTTQLKMGGQIVATVAAGVGGTNLSIPFSMTYSTTTATTTTVSLTSDGDLDNIRITTLIMPSAPLTN